MANKLHGAKILIEVGLCDLGQCYNQSLTSAEEMENICMFGIYNAKSIICITVWTPINQKILEILIESFHYFSFCMKIQTTETTRKNKHA